MKTDIFDNNSNPFTVPDGYFDALQESIMYRVKAEKSWRKTESRIIRMTPLRVLIAAAACILLIFTGAAAYTKYFDKQTIASETTVDEDFYNWLFASDGDALLVETLTISPDNFAKNEIDRSEEDEAIIRFLERDNINLIAMLASIDNIKH